MNRRFAGGVLTSAAAGDSGDFTITAAGGTIDAAGVSATFAGRFADDAAGTPAGLTITDSLGGGVVRLTGANTYTGGTRVLGGRLIGNSQALQGIINNNATVEFNQASAGTYAGVMTGTGALVKTGAGTLTLSGANTYRGGTTVAAGRLAGNATSLQGAINNNAVVEFNQAAAGTYAGVMTGSGVLVKTGAGVLTLTGSNSYTGGTLVSAGLLAGTTESLQGAIANNAAVEFNQPSAGTYAGEMAGTGELIKTGAGDLSLTGVTSIAGQASVNAGTLSVNNQLAAGGGIAVHDSATLGGSGYIRGNVTVASGGTLAPGNSPGTLAVAGDVTLAPGSTFVPEIDGRVVTAAGGAGSYDLLAASGTVNLGGTIAPRLRGISGAATNAFTPKLGDAFRVLIANSVVGSFSGVTQPVDGLPANTRFDVLYRPADVTLVVTPGSYGTLGLTNKWSANATNAAIGLDAVRSAAGTRNGNIQTVFDTLYATGADQLRGTLTEISGEAHAHALQSLNQTERSTFGAVIEGSCDMDCSAGQLDTGDALWLRYVRDAADHASDRLSSGYANRTNGIVGGYTIIGSSQVKFGVAGSYVESKVTSASAARSQSQSGAGYLYLHYLPSDRLVLSGAVGVSLADNAVTRTIVSANGPVVATSDRQSNTLMVNANASYRAIKVGSLSLWANAGVEVTDTSIGRVREQASNQDYALTLGKVDHRAGQTQLGGRVQFASGAIRASASADWVYQIGKNPTVARAVELGNARWTVTGLETARSGWRLGGQFAALLSRKVALFGAYQHTDQGHGQNHNRITGGVRLTF